MLLVCCGVTTVLSVPTGSFKELSVHSFLTCTVCIYWWARACRGMPVELEGISGEYALSFYHLGSRDPGIKLRLSGTPTCTLTF